MIYLVHHAVTLTVGVLTIAALTRSSRSLGAPRTSILLWQASTLTVALSAVGLLLTAGLRPYARGIVPGLTALTADLTTGAPLPTTAQLIAVGTGLAVVAAMVAIQAGSSWRCHRRRSRHRQLLDLVAAHDADRHVHVLDHPAVTAYYLPGRTGCVVVSRGALSVLTPDELGAVIAHEEAHARYHHHIALAPFQALHRAVPLRPFRVMANRMALLVELCADDAAARRVGTAPLVSALRSMRRHAVLPATPLDTLAAGVTALDHRIRRLDRPAPRRRSATPIGAVAVAAALVVAATPLSLFALPL
ncbi:M56 family metallopeptidase [Pseudonocardia sp. CA-107938]|uniref:M56 family metallopeptidase n=1 Tax=Pseudonocardia sp. CA-107938 TaxID=3240021 RepID=UPI003D8D9220